MKRFTTILIVAALAITFSGTGQTLQAEELTLDQCIDIALTNNGSRQYGLPSARESYHRAKQGVWSAWGDFLPSLSHNYNYRHTRFGDVTYDPTIGQFISIPEEAQTSTSWSNGFTLSQTFFDGGANFYRIAQSYHTRAAQEENVRGAENDLILGVKEGYFNLLKSHKLVEVQEAAVERAEEFLKTIESRYELGSASLSEVLKARVQLGTEQLELLRRENDVEVGRAGLNTILNRSVETEITVSDISGEEPEVMSYQDAAEQALERSPAVQIARANMRIAKDDIGIARATLFPSFSWSISRSFSPRERNDLLDFDGRFATWGISASLNFSLFNGFHRKTAISNAQVGVKYTSEQLEQAEKAVAFAVKQAHLGVELADETRNLAEQTEVSAQEDFNLAQEKYHLGAATILDLLDAQVSLTRAQNDRVNALFDYLIAVARLENAVGVRR